MIAGLERDQDFGKSLVGLSRRTMGIESLASEERECSGVPQNVDRSVIRGGPRGVECRGGDEFEGCARFASLVTQSGARRWGDRFAKSFNQPRSELACHESFQ